MRLAFLADIHGNLPALEAVANDLRRLAPDLVYLVGDQVNRCPWNNQVMDFLAEMGWPAIAGNHDLVVARINTPANGPPFTDRQRFRSLWWTAETLARRHLKTLGSLPATLAIDLPEGPPIRLVHGVPENPFVGLYPEAGDDALGTFIHMVEEPVIVSGHTHRPLVRRVGRWQLFNGGSVGLPYNGDPRAQYLLLDAGWEAGERAWLPTLRAVDYDHSAFREAYTESGMLAATGAMGELHLLTALTAHAYSSDFGIWLKSQSVEVRADLDRAVQDYLARHGPGNWAFSV